MTYETEQAILSARSNNKTAFITTNYRDNYISKGNSFANETIRAVATDEATQYFVLDPTACDCNRIFKLPISVVSSVGYVTVRLYEGTDYTGVNALPFINRDRNSSNTLQTTLKDLATGTDKGTQLFYTLFGTSETRQSSGGGAGASANVLLLDMTKKYLFEVYNESACLIGYNMELVEIQ